MAKVKNISGDDRTLNGRLVLAGQVIEVPDEDVEAHTCQETIWANAVAQAAKARKKVAPKKSQPPPDDVVSDVAEPITNEEK